MHIIKQFRITLAGIVACTIFVISLTTLAISAPVNQTAVFAGGCFWGVDAVFKHVRGVVEVISGYAGGSATTADYEDVSTGQTGHAESVRIVFDPGMVTYRQLLEIFFSVAHDPTQLNRQGPDFGTQYRSVIFYMSPDQQVQAKNFIDRLTAAHTFSSPIVTQVVPLNQFYPAEKHHQNYLASHLDQPYIVINDLPKLEQLRRKFPSLYR
jgi:peptide-methionine (S)-S-oxide reductase